MPRHEELFALRIDAELGVRGKPFFERLHRAGPEPGGDVMAVEVSVLDGHVAARAHHRAVAIELLQHVVTLVAGIEDHHGRVRGVGPYALDDLRRRGRPLDVCDPRMLGQVRSVADVYRKHSSVIKEVADRRQITYAAAEVGSRLDEPIGAYPRDSLVLDPP